LAKPAIQAVETGKIQFYPKTWEKTYFEWMYNIRDWCISRQLWWGHRIPAWYLDGYEEILVSREEPKDGSFWGRPDLKPRQDDDVLDTWFSSGLWPFSTLGWPEKTKPLETFYPNSIMETGFDIIFFWVARMIMFGMHFMDGKIPFERVYLHAMVRDEKGEKMSKSKGNVIDPMQIVDQHGADPLRFTLAAMAGQGRDIKLSVDRVEGYRAFCNKIWNATKFLHLQFEEAQGGPIAEPSQGCAQWLRDHRGDLLPANAWIVSRLQSLIQKVDDGFEKFEINESAQGIYEFAWGEFCDWFIEFSKLPLRSQGPKRIETIITLHYVLEELFKVTHPIMPYVTEELWQSLPFKKAANTPARAFDKKPPVMTVSFQKFPKADPSLVSEAAEARISELKQVILAIRNFRGENNISPKVEFAVSVFGRDASGLARFQKMQSEFKALTRVGEISITQATAAGEFDTVIPVSALGIDLRISLKGLVNVDEESKRVHKEIERITADADFVRNKLSKESFIAKAPAELVAKEKAKLAEFESKITELHAGLKRLERLK
jgi:valyl-tRNA synthetase